MDSFDNISENEIRIIGTNPEEQKTPPKSNKWRVLIMSLAVALVLLAVTLLWPKAHQEAVEPAKPVATVQQQKVDSVVVEKKAYVEISDTIINNVSLHRYIPVNAVPRLEVGLLKAIPEEYAWALWLPTSDGIMGNTR